MTAFVHACRIVATSEHLDEIGLLWITRPDGWVEQIANAHARALETAETENIEARLRRAERRREAAEQAAARASAELLAQREAIAREQQRRELAEERGAAAQKAADHAERVAAKLRSQLEATEAKLESERVRATQAEDTARALTEALRVAEQTRDAVLARRAELAEPLREAPPPAPANASAARALRNAATATRELAAALAAAGDALNGDDVRSESAPTPRSGRERRTQRRAIAIPGGVYGDSVAAGEYLVKVPGARVVVDGYNLAKLAWPGRNLIDQRERLISLLEDFARRTGVDVHAVFDGADVVGASAGRRIVRVQYSPAGVTADDVIREVVASLPVSTPAVVATNDQAIINDVRAAGANTVSSDVMLVLLGFTSPGSRRR